MTNGLKITRSNYMEQINECKCGNKAVFNHHGKGYCGSWSALGVCNLFGYCKVKKTHSPELKRFWKKLDKLYGGKQK